MRPFEILLSLTHLLTFCIWAIPRFHYNRWMGYIAPVTVLIAVIQVFVEGPRWQMIPAYTLAIIYFLIWVLGIALPGRRLYGLNNLSKPYGLPPRPKTKQQLKAYRS